MNAMMEIMLIMMDAQVNVILKVDLPALVELKLSQLSVKKYAEMVKTWVILLVMTVTLSMVMVATQNVKSKKVTLAPKVTSIHQQSVLKFVEMVLV